MRSQLFVQAWRTTANSRFDAHNESVRVAPKTLPKVEMVDGARSCARLDAPSWHIVCCLGSLMVQLRYRAEDDVIDAVIKWSEEFVEQPHELFGGLPICPFARAARIKQTIRFEVHPFALDDPLEPNGDILTLVREFVEETSAGRLETLFVIHPDPGQALSNLLAFVARLNSRMRDGELHEFQAFEDTPRAGSAWETSTLGDHPIRASRFSAVRF